MSPSEEIGTFLLVAFFLVGVVYLAVKKPFILAVIIAVVMEAAGIGIAVLVFCQHPDDIVAKIGSLLPVVVITIGIIAVFCGKQSPSEEPKQEDSGVDEPEPYDPTRFR